MLDMNQIIAAMMSQTPEVTPMGAASGGGGVGGSSSKMGVGEDLSAPAYTKRPRSPYNAAPEMPEIAQPAMMDPMVAPQPPGFPGTSQEGPPDPKMAYDREQAFGEAQALERQYVDAVNLYEKYANPRWISDKFQADEMLPQARERLAQASHNIQAYNAEQERIKAEAAARGRAETAQQAALYLGMNPEQAMMIADASYKNEDVYEEFMKSVGPRAETIDERRFNQSEALGSMQARFEALEALDLPYDVAGYLARDPDLSTEDAYTIYYDNQDRIKEAAAEWATAQRNIRDELIKTDQAINVTRTAIEDVGPFTAGIGSLLRFIPGTPAANLDYALDTLRAVTAFKALWDMRQASPTGGALGNVSNREIELLYSSWVALQVQQTPERLRENLNTLLERYQRVKFLIEAESEGKLKGISGTEQAKMADEYVTNLHMEAFRENVPNADRWLKALQAGDISKREFEDEFGFLPIMDTLQ